MKKENHGSLNEELSRMKKLMNFSMSDNSHAKLSEEFIAESTKKRKVIKEQKRPHFKALGDAKWVQDNYGNNIFSKALGKPQPLKVEPPKVEALYEDNMVTIDGAKNSDQLRQQLDEIVSNLVKTPGFDAKNVIVSVQGAANNERPTGAGPGGIKLDHPDSQPFGGIDITKSENYDAGNQYLAEKRAESVAKYISEKIPGITIKTSGKVMPGTTEEEKFILFAAKYKDEARYPQETGKVKIEFTNGLKVKLAKDFGVEGSEITQDPNQRYYQGQRILKITPAGAEGRGPWQFGFTWDGSMGNNPQVAKGKGKGTSGEQRSGTWTDSREGANKNNTVSEQWVKTVLSTSGYLNDASEADTIMNMIKDGENKTMSGVSKINDFETLIKTLGVGNSSFNMNLALRNGAFLFDYIDGKVKGGKKQS